MKPEPAAALDDTVALARGGRTSFGGFLLRLAARLPFLLIAGRLYGAEALGRYGYAVMVVELAAQLATLGLRRGLAAALATTKRPHAHVAGDALMLACGLALLLAGLLAAIPDLVFPNTATSGLDRAFPLVAVPIVISEITLAALAFRHNIAAQVRARSIIEPWVLTLAALAFALAAIKRDGLILAYVLSMVAACLASLVPFFRAFGWPTGWRPRPERLARLARDNLPLAGADAADWGSRRLDIFILGLVASPAAVGIYFAAQQLASLPHKLKTTFDPILAPVLTTAWARGDRAGVAAHVRQTGFWIITAQLGVALALGFPAGAILRTLGEQFGEGALVMGVLLAAEAIAAQAVVSEAALIYKRPRRNLAWSLASIGLQAAVTVPLVLLFGPIGAAAGLVVGVAFASVGKARLLARITGAPVAGWRLALAPATAAAAALGALVPLAPDWLQIVAGIWAILALYCLIVWHTAFRGPDRLLFARPGAPASAGSGAAP